MSSSVCAWAPRFAIVFWKLNLFPFFELCSLNLFLHCKKFPTIQTQQCVCIFFSLNLILFPVQHLVHLQSLHRPSMYEEVYGQSALCLASFANLNVPLWNGYWTARYCLNSWILKENQFAIWCYIKRVKCFNRPHCKLTNQEDLSCGGYYSKPKVSLPFTFPYTLCHRKILFRDYFKEGPHWKIIEESLFKRLLDKVF